jgi:hypothetical protein
MLLRRHRASSRLTVPPVGVECGEVAELAGVLIPPSRFLLAALQTPPHSWSWFAGAGGWIWGDISLDSTLAVGGPPSRRDGGRGRVRCPCSPGARHRRR